MQCIELLSLWHCNRHKCLTGIPFLADRTIGRAFGTMCRLSVCVCVSVVVCDVLYCGKTVVLAKVSEGANRKPGSKS